VGGREYNIVDRIGEHQLVAECIARGDLAGTPCHREYISNCVGIVQAFGIGHHDFVEAIGVGLKCYNSL
jgi:hypothetical protein